KTSVRLVLARIERNREDLEVLVARQPFGRRKSGARWEAVNPGRALESGEQEPRQVIQFEISELGFEPGDHRLGAVYHADNRRSTDVQQPSDFANIFLPPTRVSNHQKQITGSSVQCNLQSEAALPSRPKSVDVSSQLLPLADLSATDCVACRA